MEKPPDWNKCTAPPARGRRSLVPAARATSRNPSPAATLTAIACLLSSSPSFRLAFPLLASRDGGGVRGGKGLGEPQAEQSGERRSPGPGGGVPGCLLRLRGERVKKKKIRVRENEAGFNGEG